ncbi:fatty acid--CoA ligase family protein, partial [Frankia sp. Cr2]|uniref:class I adenylate-forming enzyme family protein n=1 Tax=Frankia sp. Cr2 TaxID=3073932 RepID=UPI002AD326D6
MIVPEFDPVLVLDLAERSHATFMGGVPTMYMAMLDAPDFAARDLRSLRGLLGGGSTVPPVLVRRIEEAFGARMVIGYGQSESPCIAQTWLDDCDLDKSETVGQPLPHRDVRIVRPGTTETAMLEEIGELCTRSAMTMDGYVGDTPVSSDVVDADGWLHTGDMCSMDGRGLLRFHGRLREVIIRGGENIYPREVEEALMQHPDVAQIAVVGIADDHWGEEVAAFVLPVPGTAPSVDELTVFARMLLAPFKIPRGWAFVSSFPLTASGKIKSDRQ